MMKKKFVEEWKNLEHKSKLQIMVIIVLSATIVLMAGVNVYMANTQRTIIVPSYIDKQFHVEGSKASPEYYEMMSRYAIELISNYTPETIETRVSEFRRFMSPSVYNSVAPALQKLVSDAKQYGISQYFIPQTLDLKNDTIMTSGLLRQFSGDKQISGGRTTFKLTFQINSGRFEILTYEKLENK